MSEASCYEDELKNVANRGSSLSNRMHSEPYVMASSDYSEAMLINPPDFVKQSVISKNSNGNKFVNNVRGSITEQDPEQEADESMPISPMKS